MISFARAGRFHYLAICQLYIVAPPEQSNNIHLLFIHLG